MITIVDYNAGNLRSVKRACDAVGIESEFTQSPEKVASSGRIIFPGVGAAASAMATLRETGLDRAIREAFDKGVPILGICLGAQIILEHSEEGDTECLGLIKGSTLRFKLDDPNLKIPHMGWNEVIPRQSHPLLDGLEAGGEFYFVHSYYPQPAQDSDVFAMAEYEKPFCCALGHKNLFATQFHPEKSGNFGLNMLKRFALWDGRV
ncbi:MAG: imidazole glycerol phosphate synthase subunit HisH [Candidatus Sumerlaeia bacterium]